MTTRDQGINANYSLTYGKQPMKLKFIKKYMRIAKLIGEDNNPCHSRHIGVVIVSPVSNRILGTGYNGPPPGTPHPETAEYLRDYFWPQLLEPEKQSLRLELLSTLELQTCSFDDYKSGADADDHLRDLFVARYTGIKTCPRRLVGAKSGQRNELCSCGHAERHAITNAAQCLQGAEMFCWCCVPCLQCTDAIIQAGIRVVHCLDETDYHTQSRWLFVRAGVEVRQYDPKELLSD